ncbi:MAG: PD40 domain-containing protein [Chloroflexi bacterium]|nr:PD40 domain-containing protein [Chloroflexota bacterium]
MSNDNETLIINPYIAGSPVKDAAMFFGREDVYAWLRQHLRGAYQHNAIVLYGERRSGKTSVLYQMKDKLGDPHYIPVLLDLQGMGLEGIDGFLWEVARKIVLALRGVEGVPVLDRPVRQDFEKNPRQQFEEVFLPPVLATLGARSLLLMFDEANRLAEKVEAGDLPSDIFDYLRALIQQTSRVNFLFSLGNRLEANSRGSSQLFNLAVYRKISFLEQDFVEDLVTRPIANYYTYTRPAIERIYQLTSGQAYYTQLLCHNLFTRWAKDKPAQLSVADVEAVLPDVIEQGTPNFQFVWEDSAPEERAILAALADRVPQYKAGVMRRNLDRALHQAKLYPASGDVVAGLRQLFERDVINDQEPYNFRVALMRQWISKFRRLEWVREELGDVAKQWEKLEEQRRAQAPTPREQARRWAGPVLAVVAMVLILFSLWLSQSSTAQVEEARAMATTAAAQLEVTRAAINKQLEEKQAALDAANDRAAELEASGNRLQAEAAHATANAQATEVQRLQAENTRVAVEAETAVAQAALPTATDTLFSTETPTPVPSATPTFVPTPLPTNTPTPIPTPLPTNTPRPSLAALLGGTIAYPAFEGETYNLYYGDVATGASQLIRQGASQPAFSADGSQIAFISWSGGPGRGLVTANSSGGREILVSPAPEDKLPTWSPDGRTILFFTQRSGDRASQLYWTQPDVPGRPETQQFITEGEYPTWGADGQVVFRAKGRTGVGLRLAPASLANPLPLTDRDEDTAPALAPDGQTIAFMSRRDGNWEIYTVNADGSHLTCLTDDLAMDGLPTWSPDGRAIAFVSNTGGEWAIWAITPNGRERQQLLPMRASPNGQVFFDQANSKGWTEERISWRVP